jgi:hypothetical protein
MSDWISWNMKTGDLSRCTTEQLLAVAKLLDVDVYDQTYSELGLYYKNGIHYAYASGVGDDDPYEAARRLGERIRAAAGFDVSLVWKSKFDGDEEGAFDMELSLEEGQKFYCADDVHESPWQRWHAHTGDLSGCTTEQLAAVEDVFHNNGALLTRGKTIIVREAGRVRAVGRGILHVQGSARDAIRTFAADVRSAAGRDVAVSIDATDTDPIDYFDYETSNHVDVEDGEPLEDAVADGDDDIPF